MSFDQDFVPGYFVENQRVESDNGSIGIFARADSRDVTPEDVESNLEELNDILEGFSKDQNLKFEPSILYYHDRMKSNPTVLEMAHTTMNLNGYPSLNDVFFVMKMVSVRDEDRKTYIVRLNDRLQTTSKNLSVWEYDKGKFNRLKDVEGYVSNNKIHNATNHLYRAPSLKEINPFKEIAITVHPSLRGQVSG